MISPRKQFLSILISLFIVLLAASSAVASEKNKKKKSGDVAAGKHVAQILWRNPGAVEKLDFAGGPGGRSGAPRPPFQFVEENLSGTNPKVRVTDAIGRHWSVKWGDEVHAETFAARLVWASGYDVTPNYFLTRGQIQGVKGLTRAKKYVDAQGNFANARFSLRDKPFKLLKDEDWNWNENPFVGTREFNGLKILMMLASNWDLKDGRNPDADGETNNGIREIPIHGRTTRIYMVTDWGSSMGKWGGFAGREKWDCKGYAQQTPNFIKGMKDGVVEWGFRGKHTEDATRAIGLEDVKWLLQYVGRISDQQIRNGLKASGATPEEVGCFTAAVRQRIRQMQSLVKSAGAPPIPKPVT